MRVGYDISSIFGRTGIGRYSRELLLHVLADPQVRAILVGSASERPVATRFFGALDGHEMRPLLTDESALGNLFRGLVRVRRARQFRRAFHGADVVHYLGPQKIFADHARVVSTVHDLIPLLPGFDVDPGLRARFPGMVARQLRRSSAVVCPSAWVAGTVREAFPWFTGPVHVTPLAAGASFRPVPLSEATARRLAVGRPFVLFVGHIGVERKNLARILRAWRGVDPRVRGESEFLVVTDQRPGAIDRFLRGAALDGGGAPVRFLTDVSTPELVELLGAALGLVFASQAEGFGLPILEAMQCGCPVITSATSSMPEVGGQAALYCDPRREASIEDAITRLLGDESLRRSLGDGGLARAREFSWEITARRTVEVYSSLVRA